jgi:hypothetical protein
MNIFRNQFRPIYTHSSSIVPIRIELKAPRIDDRRLRKLVRIKAIRANLAIVDYRGFELIPMGTLELEGVYTQRTSAVSHGIDELILDNIENIPYSYSLNFKW